MQVKNLTALFVHCTYQKPLYVWDNWQCGIGLSDRMDEVQFSDFDTALQKALGQQGSALKQVLIFN